MKLRLMASKMSGKWRRMSDTGPFKDGHNVRCLKQFFIHTVVCLFSSFNLKILHLYDIVMVRDI